MIGFARHHQRHPMWLRDAEGMIAADLGARLSDAVLAVVGQAAAGFAHDAAHRIAIHVARFHLLDVVGQQLDAMGIDAAQIGGDERCCHQSRRGFGDVKRFQNPLREASQRLGRDQHLGFGHVRSSR